VKGCVCVKERLFVYVVVCCYVDVDSI